MPFYLQRQKEELFCWHLHHHLTTTAEIHLATLAPLNAGQIASVPVCFHPPGTPQRLFAEEKSPNLDLS